MKPRIRLHGVKLEIDSHIRLYSSVLAFQSVRTLRLSSLLPRRHKNSMSVVGGLALTLDVDLTAPRLPVFR